MPCKFLVILPLALVAGCSELRSYGAAALEHRRTVNDLQARAAMAGTCDISLGAYFRELSPIERRYAGLVCGGQYREAADPWPERFAAP